MSPSDIHAAHVHYPESDGKPMGETDLHRDTIIDHILALDHHHAGDPLVYVSGDIFVYYEEGNPSKVVCPDVLFVRGIAKGKRRTYKVWDEGKAPDLVLEITSRSTHRQDLVEKRRIYSDLAVSEYFIFDPEGDHFEPPLRGFRREGSRLEPLREQQKGPGRQVFRSDVLGLELQLAGLTLRWVDPGTGKALPVPADAYARAEAEARRAEMEAHRAELEARRAAEEQMRADAAQAEVARLRAELERLRGGGAP